MDGLFHYLVCYLSVKKLALAACALGAVGAGTLLARRKGWVGRLAEVLAFTYVLFQVVVALHLLGSHLRFPLYLETMEGVTAMHLERLASGQALYVAPSAAFVSLAYNPGFYVACLPMYAFIGDALISMRLVSGLAWFGLGALVGYVAHASGARRAVTALAVGAYFSAYLVFDAYLDTAHADALFLLLVVGAWTVMWRRPTRGARLTAIVMLVAAFWVKQHGAVFLMGALAYLTFVERSWRVWPYWAVAIVGGPLAYLAAGPVLFGPEFHWYTYTVPSSWSCLSMGGWKRLVGYGLVWTPCVALAWRWWRQEPRLQDPWTWGLACAVGTSMLGVMDIGSSDNVLIAGGLWCLLLGTVGLGVSLQGQWSWSHAGWLGAYLLQLVVLLYNPADVLPDAHAELAYQDLVDALARTQTPIYAVQMGRLPRALPAAAEAGWVPLVDLTRGPTEGRDHPLTHEILAPVCGRPTYVLTNWPLEHDHALGFLVGDFQRVHDFGSRFRALRILPTRFGTHWPRYLYANRPALACSAGARGVKVVSRSP